MRVLIQGDLFMRVDILQACVEDALRDLGLPLEFETITLQTPRGDLPLPTTEQGPIADAWNQSTVGESVSEFGGPLDLLLEPIREIDVLIAHTAAVTRRVLAAGRRLKAVAVGRGGPVNVDIAAATELGIPILNTPGRNARAVAEFIMGLLLAADRNVIPGAAGLKQGLWRQSLYNYDVASPGFEGRVMGMIGFGRVGRYLAPFARAFGVRLLAYDPYVSAEDIAAFGARKLDSLEELIPQADFVVILARAAAETVHLIGARELALMKPTAYLVNAARGPLLDYDALYPCLRERRIKGALLDTFAVEPPRADNPLLALDNVLLTPHLAGATQETVVHAGQMMAADLRRLLRGERPLYCLNPATLEVQQRTDRL
jgi:D-3-phosphoglycerate dehydrogenase / 2-oxoglutarate reductase